MGGGGRIGAALAVAAALAGCAAMGDAPVRYAGGVLVDSAGMTLYTFDKDPSGKSVCVDRCAALWPPLAAAADARPGGDFSVVVRGDGTRQWAYRGRPLYRFSKDAKPGDRTGDGWNGVWHVIGQETSPMGGYGGYSY